MVSLVVKKQVLNLKRKFTRIDTAHETLVEKPHAILKSLFFLFPYHS